MDFFIALSLGVLDMRRNFSNAEFQLAIARTIFAHDQLWQVVLLFAQVWFQNRRAKFRKTERLQQQKSGSTQSKESAGKQEVPINNNKEHKQSNKELKGLICI